MTEEELIEEGESVDEEDLADEVLILILILTSILIYYLVSQASSSVA